MDALIQQAATASPAHLKAHLPIPYVFEREGVEVVRKGEKLAVVCPFHDDSDPSLDIWQDDSGWRWGCFPCSIGGDVLDLVDKLGGGLPFSSQVEEAVRLLGDLPPGWEAPISPGQKKPWDSEAEQGRVLRAQEAGTGAVWDFLSAKEIDVDPEELAREWGLGSDGDEVVIPYYNRNGDLVAWKHRTPDTPAISAPGSSVKRVLYGEWRDDPGLPVLLCEGESDVWAAWAAVGDRLSVMGVPGAGQHPQADWLQNRRVLLAFDGDNAGRNATRQWSKYLLGQGCTVEFVNVPDGHDLRSVRDIASLVDQPRRLKPAPTSIGVQSDSVYCRIGKNTNEVFTNWVLNPTRELVDSEGCTAYHGMLVPSGRMVTLTSADLSTKARIVSWCTRYGVAWMGSDRDAQALLALLQSEGPYLPTGRLVSTAGLHDTEFVWPGGNAGGATDLVYTVPSYDVQLDQRISIPEGEEWTPLQVESLRSLHRRDVMDPILGWLAAAPVRSLLSSFPPLAVTGGSGSGKTTLIAAMVNAFSGAEITTNLTSTTKHALSAFMASTNAFPVWFDEYRPGARKDTQMALDQLLRDAYTAQVSAKGGLGERWSEVAAMETHAPVIVSGEDTFTETSHTERMVNLPLPSRGKNPDVLRDVSGWGPTGLPLAYLTWLSAQLREGALSLDPQPFGDEALPTRQRMNLGTVRFGFDLLDRFCQAYGLAPLGPPDLSLVEEAGAEASQHNPIKDSMLWALDETDTFPFIQCQGDKVFIRVASFVNYVNKQGSFQLPGRAAAVDRYLRDQYRATPAMHAFVGREVTCLSIHKESL